MTGLECLHSELLKRGCNNMQLQSKVIPIILDIVANSGIQYQQIDGLQDEIKALMSKRDELKRQISRLEAEFGFAQGKIDTLRKQEWLDAPEYVKDFYKALETCETDSGRDAMKCAQMFVNSVSVDTKYDNTAFIIGLSAILSGGKVAAIRELHKINKRIPNPEYRDLPEF